MMSNDDFLREFHDRRQGMLSLVESGDADIVESRSRYAWARDLAGVCIGTHGDALVEHWLIHRGKVQSILSRLRRTSSKVPTAFQLRHDKRKRPEDLLTIGQRARQVLEAGFAALKVFDPTVDDYGASRFQEKLLYFSGRWHAFQLAVALQSEFRMREKNRVNAGSSRGRFQDPDSPGRKVSVEVLLARHTPRALHTSIPAADVWQALVEALCADSYESTEGKPSYMRFGDAQEIRYRGFASTLSRLRRSRRT